MKNYLGIGCAAVATIVTHGPPSITKTEVAERLESAAVAGLTQRVEDDLVRA